MAASRRALVAWAVGLAAGEAVFSSSAAPAQCTWCEAGPCNGECPKELALLKVSISSAVGGRAFPYWQLAGTPKFGKEPQPHVRLAVLVQHGDARNGEDYLCGMANALAAAGLADSTLVLAPQVYELNDAGLDQSTMIWWDKDGRGLYDAPDRKVDGSRNWKWGGNSTAQLPESLSTFDVFDEIVTTLRDPKLYPNLRRIVVTGHSAGGQTVQRYALFNRVDAPNDRVTLEYYPANPSTSTYLDASRPVREPRVCGAFCDNATLLTKQWKFTKPDGNLECLSTYNSYGYGLDGDLPPYLSKTGREAAIEQYKHRRVTYVSGESDICNSGLMKTLGCCSNAPDDGGIDGTCEADAQGWCRMSRFHAYLQHVRHVYKDQSVHSLLSVPAVGHNGCAIYQSKEFAAAVFNRPTSGSASSLVV